MGAEAAQDYVAAWIGVVSDSDLGAKQREELENELSDIDWSNMSDAISGMKAMTDAGMDPAKIREFWDVATSSAKTHVKSVEEAITIVDNFHKKSVETSEAIDNLLEGKGTAEDLELLRQANLDFTDSLVQTADGWQLVGSKTREATDALKKYNLEQLEMATQAQANRVESKSSFAGMSSPDGSISMEISRQACSH